jgi:Neuraminidase (sialidase)
MSSNPPYSFSNTLSCTDDTVTEGTLSRNTSDHNQQHPVYVPSENNIVLSSTDTTTSDISRQPISRDVLLSYRVTNRK